MEDHGKTKEQPVTELTELRHATELRQNAEERLRTQNLMPTGLQKSDQRQNAILDNIPDPAWLKDTEGRYLAVNAAWCRFFGMDAKSVLGKTAFEFLPSEVAVELRKTDCSTIQSRHLLQYEELLTDKDGREVWFETTKSPLFNDHGDVVGTTGLARDITARKQAERDLSESIEHYRSLFTNMLDGYACCEMLYEDGKPHDFIYLDVNPAFERLTGLAGVVGKKVSEVIRGVREANPELFDIYGRVAHTGRPEKFETYVASLGIWFSIAVYCPSDGRFVAVFDNITDRKRMEQERQIAIEFLHLVNESTGLHDLIHRATDFLREQSGCEAVGIRLREGDDYPYFETRGFPAEFVHAENSLCVRCENGEPQHDGDGNPVLDCMCGNVICGRFNPSKPFFTPKGSFWTNCTTELLASTTEADRQARTRNRCNGEGYESVALIRLHSGNEPLGLLQLNDHRKGLFTAETIAFWERLAGYLAVAIAKSRTEKKLRESEARYRSLFENNLDGIFLTRSNGAVEDANPAACSMLGMSREEIARVGRAGVLDPNDPRFPALLEQRDRMGRINCELTCIRKDGQKFPAEISSVVLDGDDEERQAFVMVRDITERKRAEQEKLDMERHLLHAQKLESLGILAGGIAHDFNNILAGIMGYADLVKVQLPASEPARKDVDIIKKATRRAADLTRQMLAYSGKGKFIVEPVSLSRVVKDMRAMLAMSISKKATLNCNLASDLPMIEADASQIHQIILNLVINASEALGEDSGVITISTDTIQCSGTDCAALGGDELREGLYVRLEVSDTGCGMDEETLAKIFDPFFTTKFTGRGLGLAAVHGILRGHKGGIRVTSKPGQGTTFQVLFPAIETPALLSAGEPSPAKPWHGTGTVLVVDDEEIVRSLAKKMVKVAGFSVLTASDGEEAVRLYRKHQDEIACVLLDLTMPKLNGEETFRAIRQISPGVRVILSSGYGEEFATGRFSGMGLAGFIQKPYQLDTMIATLREAMGENEGDHPARLRQ